MALLADALLERPEFLDRLLGAADPELFDHAVRAAAEIDGRIDIPLGARRFRLTARADRIEQLSDGRFAILDYKTGQAPTEKQVRIGLSPQLTLEAAILRGEPYHK